MLLVKADKNYQLMLSNNLQISQVHTKKVEKRVF